jgi:hypothetical protein
VSKTDKTLRWWEPRDNAGEPAGITELATVLLHAYIGSSLFRKRLYTSVLFLRDSDAESWNHFLRIWCVSTPLILSIYLSVYLFYLSTYSP